MRWLLVQVGRYLDQLVIFLVVCGRVRRQVLQVSKVEHMERKIQMKSSTFCQTSMMRCVVIKLLSRPQSSFL